MIGDLLAPYGDVRFLSYAFRPTEVPLLLYFPQHFKFAAGYCLRKVQINPPCKFLRRRKGCSQSASEAPEDWYSDVGGYAIPTSRGKRGYDLLIYYLS